MTGVSMRVLNYLSFSSYGGASMRIAIFFAIILSVCGCMQAQTINWKGHQWRVTHGGMAGVAAGNPANVDVDANGYLHLRIVNRDGTWNAAEVFTTDKLGFGTYQWVIQGNVYDMDKSTVLGLFTYGPVAHLGADAENEIDIEFSKWNNTCHGCNADFTVYPATGNRKKDGTSSWEDNFHADYLVATGETLASETLTTARMEWAGDQIVFTIMKGIQPIGTVADVIKTETYRSKASDIPQVASPVGINLWCFKETPSTDQSVVIRDFQFVPRPKESPTSPRL